MSTSRYITSALASVVHLSGDWYVTSPAADRGAAIDPPGHEFLSTVAALLAECHRPLDEGAILERLRAMGQDERSAQRLFLSLCEVGLLVEEGTGARWEALAARSGGGSLAEAWTYLSLGESVGFLDYARPDVFETDAAIMRAYCEASPPPPVYTTYEGAPRIRLPHPATAPPMDAAGKLARLLFGAFGRLREATFLETLPVLLKPVPSQGARHPLEAYVWAGSASCLDPGLYHYAVAEHALELLDSPAAPPPGGGTLLAITAVFERVQWRYRASWNYKEIFYDLGHVQANLGLLARDLGLALAPIEAGPELIASRPLEEECVSAYRLEGLG